MIKLLKKCKGIGTLELLLAIGIIAAFTVGVLGIYGGLRTFDLEETPLKLINHIRLTRNNSIMGEGGSAHGIKFEANRYIMYHGSSYETRDPEYDEIIELPKGIILCWLLHSEAGPSDEINFTKGDGIPDSIGLIAETNVSENLTKLIRVNKVGKAAYEPILEGYCFCTGDGGFGALECREETICHHPPGVGGTGSMCNGKAATIYVERGVIHGGPLDGDIYNGILRGTIRDDVIVGTAEDETIYGGDGDDVICGMWGDNIIYGEDGKDIIFSRSGNDTIYGGNDDSIIEVEGGNNYIEGGNGDDEITTGAGNDTILGKGGEDILISYGGANNINGGSDNKKDIICTGNGNDTIDGGDGKDAIDTHGGEDTINGGAGEDICFNGENITSCERTLACEEQGCSLCSGKVSQLTLRFNGEESASIVVKQKNKQVIYSAYVNPGQEFTINGTDNGTFGNEIKIYKNYQGDDDDDDDDDNYEFVCHKEDSQQPHHTLYVPTEAVQAHLDHGDSSGPCANGDDDDDDDDDDDIRKYVKIHTSCSRQIGPGLIVGDFEVVSGHSKDGGILCEINCESIPECNNDYIEYYENEGEGICHYSQINRNITRTMYVPEEEVELHLAHGDIQDICDNDTEIRTMTINSRYLWAHVHHGDGIGECENVCHWFPPYGEVCGECNGGVNELTMRYNGEESASIVVKQKNNNVIFGDFVEPGQEFTITGIDNGTFGQEIKIYTNYNGKDDDNDYQFICHKPVPPAEHTLYLPNEAVPGHLGHGDSLGKCGEGDDDDDDESGDNDDDDYGNNDDDDDDDDDHKAKKKYVKIYTDCTKEIGPGLIVGDFEVVSGTSKDGGVLCSLEQKKNCEYARINVCHYPSGSPEDLNNDCVGASQLSTHMNHGDVLGRCAESATGTSMTLTINQESLEAHLDHGDVLGECPEVPRQCALCGGGIKQIDLKYLGTESANVKVEQSNNDIIFNDSVSAGQELTLIGTNDGVLGNDIKVYINDVENATFNTSCSELIGQGFIQGSFEVKSGISKYGIPLCPMPDCEECVGKISALTIKYHGAQGVNIRVKQKNNDIIFDSFVDVNQEFSFNGTDNGTFGNEIRIYENDQDDGGDDDDDDGGNYTKIHTSCSQDVGPGYIKDNFEVISGESKDNGALCPIIPEGSGGGSGDSGQGCCDGKVSQLKLQYNGSETSNILIKQHNGGIIFNSNVPSGGQFSFIGTDNGSMGPKIKVYVNASGDDDDDDGGDYTEIHTSCSQPIGPGLVVEDFEVISGESKNGGTLCSL